MNWKKVDVIFLKILMILLKFVLRFVIKFFIDLEFIIKRELCVVFLEVGCFCLEYVILFFKIVDGLLLYNLYLFLLMVNYRRLFI